MSTAAFLDELERFALVLATQLPSAHAVVPLRPLRDAKLLWINPHAQALDTSGVARSSAPQDYRAKLLEACAYATHPQPDEPAAGMGGGADRYGGSGVGHNGGSGRSVTINGYLVKGVGRTPLVGHGTDVSHASGGAYLEEAVREVIFTKVFASQFPHGVVPILAIIDTQLLQHWTKKVEPQVERRVLIVRPPVLRAAHFERALGFDSGFPCEGVRDAQRLREVFAAAVAQWGANELAHAIEVLGQRLAAQIGFGFAHRLLHGSPNSSNVSLDGRLFDFGAASAVPSWADVATMLTPQPFEKQFNPVAETLISVGYYAAKYLARPLPVKQWIDAARLSFKAWVTSEALRVLGLPADLAQQVRDDPQLHGAWPAVARIFLHFQQEHLDHALSTPASRLPWDVQKVWDERPPAHLAPASQWLRAAIPPRRRTVAQAQCRALSSTRPELYRQSMKKQLHAALGLNDAGEREVTDLISGFSE